MDLKQRGSEWINSTEEHTNVVIKKHKRFKNWKSTVIVLAMVVLLGSAYAMILPALTMNQQAYCGEEEHVHTDACYEQRLICTFPETADGHKHTDSCYEKVLVCELKEHTHELICYSNPEADVETQAVWERSVSKVSLTGVWADDLVNIAKSQLGYKESKNNYIVEASGSIKGYTRYGAWYGDAYADWSGMFASFCINYAGISKEEMPAEANSPAWAESLSQKGLYKAAGEYAPQKGDLVFFSSDEKADEPDHVGIIAEIVNDKDGNPVRISVIEGDSEDEVVKTTYELKDGHITGYGKLPENPNGAGPKKAAVKAKAATLASNETPSAGGHKPQITAKKTIDGGNTPIGSNRFKFRLTGNGQDVTVENDENGDILFPEMTFTEAGTYTYTIEELTDERDGVTFDFDKSKQTVTVTVTEHDVQIYDSSLTYYGLLHTDNYTYIDSNPNGRGIRMHCTRWKSPQDGPQHTSEYPQINQTYNAVINPDVITTGEDGMIRRNIYDTQDQLKENLKKLFSYLESDEAKQFKEYEKDNLVWAATGNRERFTSSVSWWHGFNGDTPVTIGGETLRTTNIYDVLNLIYKKTTAPENYNLVFFLPSGNNRNPQPLMTGYGAVVDSTADEVVFDNTSKAQNSLKIGKTVTGTAGETDRLFNFTISLWNQYFSQLTGNLAVIPGSIDGVEAPEINQLTFSYGSATIQLKHGQHITIIGLPDQFHYHVTETEWSQDGYSSSLTGDSNSNYADYEGATGAVDVEFKNHKDAPSPPPSFETEIKAKKTLNGEIPADGQFTFILRNSAGEEIDRKTNDANGEVTFPLTITEAGTYTYTVEEVNDGQEGIVYDTAVKTVTVTVGSETLQEIVDGDSFTGSGTTGNFKITVNGTKDLDVYCIDGSVGNPSGYYDKVLNPTTAQLEEQVTANYYGNLLAENMRKLLYYFDTHSYTESVTGDYYSITLDITGRQELIWCLTGNPGEQDDSYQNPLNTILAESNPPGNYTVVMFASQGNAQPVIAGYLPTTNVVYEGEAGMVEFANYYEYILPETGGRGTTGYILGGLLLLFSAAILMYIYKLERRKGGSC